MLEDLAEALSPTTAATGSDAAEQSSDRLGSVVSLPAGPLPLPPAATRFPKPATCQGCPLLDEPGPVWMDGPREATSLFLLEAPGPQEALLQADGRRHPAVGSAGRYHDELLRKAGLRRENVAVGNAVACFPPEKLVNGKREHPVPLEAFRACRVHRERLLASLPKLKHIHLMGKWAAGSFLGEKVQIDAWQGAVARWSEVEPLTSVRDLTLTFSIHPARAMRERMEMPVIQDHFRRAARVSLDPEIHRREIQVLDLDLPFGAPAREAWGGVTVTGLVDGAWSLLWSKPKIFFFDTETEGEDRRITRISFTTSEGIAATVAWSAKVREWIRPVLEAPGVLKIAHNFAFDHDVLKRAGILVAQPWFCTMTALAILTPDLPNRLEFGVMLARPSDFLPWKHLSDVDPVLYSGVDAAVLPILYEWEQARLGEEA